MAKVLNMWFFSKIMTQSPKHTCKKTKSWLKDSNLEVIVWLAQFPDLNPIELFWSHLKKKLEESENPHARIAELWERVEREWNNILASVCQDFIKSMPRSVVVVPKVNGLY